MKTGWKSWILAGAVLAVACSVAVAGPGGGPGWGQGKGRGAGRGMGFGPQMGPERPEAIARLFKRLDLTDEQATRIREIFEQAKSDAQAANEAVANAREDLHNGVTSGATEEQIRSAAAALGTAIGNQAVLRTKTMTAAKAVLTDEQRAKLEKLMEKLPALRERARGAAFDGPAGRPQRMRNGPNGPAEPPAGERGRGPGPLPLEKIFKAADADKDGALTMEELRAFQEARRGGDQQP